MLVKLENPILLSKVVEIISELVAEVKIKINEQGLSITAMDPANVALVGFKLPKNSFSQFETGTETLGINVDNLKQVLKRCGAGSSLILEKQENQLKIQIQDRIKRSFSLSLIEVESEDKQIPNLEYSAKIEINSVDFVASIEDCAVVADACSFIVKDNIFTIKAKSLNSAMSEFSGDEAKIEAEECRAKYSLEYLQKFMKGAKLCNKTLIQFADDHPLRLDFKTDFMDLSFILAPRVETEE